MVNQRSVSLLAIALAWFIAPSCANGNLGESLQQFIAADPRLADGVVEGDESTPTSIPRTCSDNILVQLPAEFPVELCYPNAELLDVSTSSDEVSTVTTEWTADESISAIQDYYLRLLETASWEVIDAADTGDNRKIDAVKQGDRIIVQFSILSSSFQSTTVPEDEEGELNDATLSGATKFVVEFQSDRAETEPNDGSDESANRNLLTPEDARLFSQINPEDSDSESSTRTTTEDSRPQRPVLLSASFTDIDQAPEELQIYIEDLAALGILTSFDGTGETAGNGAENRRASSRAAFNPNEPINRQEYAQWLLTANNLFYGDRPSRKIRPATSSITSAFQDVSSSNPSYAAIQGLADAGLIPSTLSGGTEVNFRPTAALTREELIRWKVPLDRRGSLPETTLNTIEDAWGFQDVAQITPDALPMIFADFQNGDQANILRAFGYTTLFQPQKAVTRAEAAAVLWHFGYQADGISADDL